MTMQYDNDKIDRTVLALLARTLHDVSEEGGRAWKGHDWEVLNRLHAKGLISNPVSKAKSVALTPEAVEASQRLFDELFGAADQAEEAASVHQAAEKGRDGQF